MAKATILKRSLLLLASILLLANILFCGITYAKYSNTTEFQTTMTVQGLGGCYTQSGGLTCTENDFRYSHDENKYKYRFRAEYNFKFMNYKDSTIGSSGYTPNMVVTCTHLDVYWSAVAELVVYKYSGDTLAEINSNITNNIYEEITYTSVETISNVFTLTTNSIVGGTQYEMYACKVVIPYFQDTSRDGDDMCLKIVVNP